MRPVCLALLFPALLMAQTPSTVMITRKAPDGGLVQGSGVLCGASNDLTRRAILSVRHVTGGKGSTVNCYIRKGYKHTGVVVGDNAQLDMSLVVIRGDYIRDIPSAGLYFGQVTNVMATRTEGFPGGFYREVSSRPLDIKSGRVLFAGAAARGTSGGPQYIAGTDRFISLTSHSDLEATSIGPYRSALVDFVKTCSGGFNNFGRIRLDPRVIDGPIAVPEPAPADTASRSRPPRPVADDNKSAMEALRAQLESIVKQKRANLNLAQAAADPPKPAEPVAEEPIKNNGEVITLNIPVKLRVTVTDQRQIEVEEVK